MNLPKIYDIPSTYFNFFWLQFFFIIRTLQKRLLNQKANGSSMGLRDVPWREICEEWGDCCDSQIARWMPQSVGRRAHRVQDSKAPPREWLPNIATKSKRGENQSSFFWHTHPLLSTLLLLLTLIKKALHGTKFFFLWCCHSLLFCWLDSHLIVWMAHDGSLLKAKEFL